MTLISFFKNRIKKSFPLHSPKINHNHTTTNSPQYPSSSSSSSSSSSPSFSYSSSSLSYPVETLARTIMEDTLDIAVKIITEWQSYDAATDDCPNTSLFDHRSREDFLQFMRAVKDLQSALLFLTSLNNNSSSFSTNKKLLSAQSLLKSAIKRLGRDFFTLLKSTKPGHLLSPHPPRKNSDVVFTSEDFEASDHGIEPSPIDDLKLIADCMMSSGYGKKCLKIYKLTRRSIVEDAVLKLGIRKLKKAQVQRMDWDAIETKIKEWTNAVKKVVKQIFLGEKILCDHLFSSIYSLPPVKDSCFADVCKDSALNLFRIPGKLAKHSRRASERVFSYLKLYESLSDLSPDVDLIFSSDLSAPVRYQARSSMARIADAVKSTLSDFEVSVQKDASKALVPGGGLHPLTRHVMSYLCYLANYSSGLDKILTDCPVNLQSPLPERLFGEGETPASPAVLRFGWLILVLLCKLDGKSEFYKDASLSYLFLANNLQYVVTKVVGSRLRPVLGEKWVVEHAAKVIQYSANYERMGWGRVIAALPDDPSAENMPIDKVKECFRKFNAEFAEEYRKQVDWVVVDSRLRDQMKASVATRVGRRYRGMYDKYNEVIIRNRERGVLESVVKFTPEDLQNFLAELLDGPEAYTDDVATPVMVPVTGEEATTTTTTGGTSEAMGVQRRRKRLLHLIREKTKRET